MDLTPSSEKGAPRHQPWSPAAAACITALLGLLLACVRPGHFLWDDNVLAFLPFYTHNLRVLLEAGEPALVNWFQYNGIPHLAHGQQGVLYPPVYAAFGLASLAGLDSSSSITILVVAHLAGAAASVAWLAAKGGWSPPSALACGLLWATTPFVLVLSCSWIFVAYAACWAPACLALLLRCITQPTARSWALLAAAKALFFLQGYAQYAFYYYGAELALLGLLALREASVRRLRWWAGYAGHGLIAAGLAAPLLLPLWQAVRDSQERGSLSLEQKLQFSLNPTQWAKANFLHFESVLFGLDSRIYFLLPLLALAACMLAAQRKAPSPGAGAGGKLGAACLHGALAAWALSTPAFLLLAWLPVLGWFRWPLKIYFFVPFLLLASIALGGHRAESLWPRFTRMLLGLALSIQLSFLLLPQQGATISGLRPASQPLWPGVSWDQRRIAAAGFSHPHSRFAETFQANSATLHGIFAYWGYDPLVPARAALGKPADYFHRMWNWPPSPSDHKAGNTWAVSHAITHSSADSAAGWTLEAEWNGLRLWRNDHALPLARWEDESPAGTVRTHGNSLHVSWNHPLPASRSLHLAFTPLAGLEARTLPESQRVPVGQDQGMIVMNVPPGATGISVAFRSPFLPATCAAAAAAALTLACIALSPKRGQFA